MLCTCFHGRKWQSRCFCISFCISFPSNFFQAWLPMALMFFGASQGRVAASEVKTRSDICGTLHVAQAMGEMLLDLLRINRPRRIAIFHSRPSCRLGSPRLTSFGLLVFFLQTLRSLSRISTSWQEPTNEGLPQGSFVRRVQLHVTVCFCLARPPPANSTNRLRPKMQVAQETTLHAQISGYCRVSDQKMRKTQQMLKRTTTA